MGNLSKLDEYVGLRLQLDDLNKEEIERFGELDDWFESIKDDITTHIPELRRLRDETIQEMG